MNDALKEFNYRSPMSFDRLLFAFLGLTERLGRPNTVEHVMDITKKHLVVVEVDASTRPNMNNGLVLTGCRVALLEDGFDEAEQLMYRQRLDQRQPAGIVVFTFPQTMQPRVAFTQALVPTNFGIGGWHMRPFRIDEAQRGAIFDDFRASAL